MPYLILSDIHANLEAQQAVLADAQGNTTAFFAWAIWWAMARIPMRLWNGLAKT